jgi:hypothetical protein
LFPRLSVPSQANGSCFKATLCAIGPIPVALELRLRPPPLAAAGA